MKASQKIERLKRDVRELFGDGHPATRSIELRERYALMAEEAERLRSVGYTYQESIDRVCLVFYCSEGTAKRALRFYAGFTKMDLNL